MKWRQSLAAAAECSVVVEAVTVQRGGHDSNPRACFGLARRVSPPPPSSSNGCITQSSSNHTAVAEAGPALEQEGEESAVERSTAW